MHNMQNMQFNTICKKICKKYAAMCRFCSYSCILTGICKICKIYAKYARYVKPISICRICTAHFADDPRLSADDVATVIRAAAARRTGTTETSTARGPGLSDTSKVNGLPFKLAGPQLFRPTTRPCTGSLRRKNSCCERAEH